MRNRGQEEGRTEGVTDATPPTSSAEQPTTSVEEIALAIERGDVPFSMVVRALYGQWSAGTCHLREQNRRLYRPALSGFMTAHDGIVQSHYADEFTGGVVLTGTHELFAEIAWDSFDFDTSPARALEADLNDLRLKAAMYLGEDHRRACVERLMRLYKGLISSLRVEFLRWTGATDGDHRSPTRGHVSDLEQLRRELDDVLSTYNSIGTARGQARYIFGAAAGAVAIVAAAGLAAILTGSVEHTIWLGAIAGGAVGALLSVLERLKRRALNIQFDADPLVISGIARPAIGAISGLAMFALIEGGLVPFDVPDSDTSRGLFYAGIGFLAGFSERLAKDVFGSAASSLAA